MPELPEVSTTVRQLNNVVVGKTITDVWSDYHENSTPKTGTLKDPHFYGGFVSTVTGTTIAGVDRRGKNILIHLAPSSSSEQATPHTILIHMKMTGHLLVGKYQKDHSSTTLRLASGETVEVPEKWRTELWRPATDLSSPLWDPFNRHINLVFTFKDNTHLVLSDMRRFAKVTLYKTGEIDNTELAELGPDPYNLSPAEFRNVLRERRSGKIKEVLMDQSTIAGIGNIYSDEALFEAHIHPETDVHDLSDEQLSTLHTALKNVMSKAMETGGDSDSDYRNLYGRKGNFQNFHKVYRRTEQDCPRRGCSGSVERIRVNSRSAHFCPRCQQPQQK